MKVRQYNCHIACTSDGDYAEMVETKFGEWANMDDVASLLLELEALRQERAAGLVFEAADVSNEETYWTLGLWPTLDDALNALRVDDPTDIGCHDADEYDEHRTIEVRERKIGWCGMGRRVAKLEWKATYDEASDEYKWTRSETVNTKGQR